jgi:hypothetical protein
MEHETCATDYGTDLIISFTDHFFVLVAETEIMWCSGNLINVLQYSDVYVLSYGYVDSK